MDNGSAFGNLSYDGPGDFSSPITGYGFGDTMYRGAHSLSGLGQRIAPFVVGRPQPTEIGHGGLYYQPTGFLEGAAYTMGMGYAPHHATSIEYGRAITGDFGERLGLGGVTAATTLGGLALGANSFMGVPLLGSIMGKMGAGIGGAVGSSIGGVGMATGSTIGGFIGSWIAAPMAGLAVAQGITESVTDRLVNQSILDAESFRFVGAGSPMASTRLGSGMSRRARQEATEFIREMDIESEFFGDEEFRQILQESMRKGLFVGSGDMDTFKRRFKDITENVKEIMKVMNVSLDEGLSVISELRQFGIDPGRSREVAALADATGRVAGRTSSEMITFGMQGAQHFVGTGISTEIGMQANMANLAAVRAARDAGMISQQALAHLGGETGAANFLTQSGLSFMRTGIGRGFTASYFDPAMGGFDRETFVSEMTTGAGTDLMNLYERTAKRFRDPVALIQFQNQQEQILSEMGQAFGGQGLQLANMFAAGGLAQQLQRYVPGLAGEDAYKYVLKTTYGYSDSQANLVLGMIKNREDDAKKKEEGARVTKARRDAVEAEERSPMYQAYEKLKDWSADLFDQLGGRTLSSGINDLIESLLQYQERQKGIFTYDTSSTDLRSVMAATDDLVTARDIRDFTDTFSADFDEAGGHWGFGKTLGDEMKGLLTESKVFGEDAIGRSALRGLVQEVRVNVSETRKDIRRKAGVQTFEALRKAQEEAIRLDKWQALPEAERKMTRPEDIKLNLIDEGEAFFKAIAMDKEQVRPDSDLADRAIAKQKLRDMGFAGADILSFKGYRDDMLVQPGEVKVDLLTPEAASLMSDITRVSGMSLTRARELEKIGLGTPFWGERTGKEVIMEGLLSGAITGKEKTVAEMVEAATGDLTDAVVGRFLKSPEAAGSSSEKILSNLAKNRGMRNYFGEEGIQRFTRLARVTLKGLPEDATEERKANEVRHLIKFNMRQGPLAWGERHQASILVGLEDLGLENIAKETRRAATFVEDLKEGRDVLRVSRAIEEEDRQKERFESLVSARLGPTLGDGVEMRQGVWEALLMGSRFQREYADIGIKISEKEALAAKASGDQKRSLESDIVGLKRTRERFSDGIRAMQETAIKRQVSGREPNTLDFERGVREAEEMVGAMFTPTKSESTAILDIQTQAGAAAAAARLGVQEIIKGEIGQAALAGLRADGRSDQEIREIVGPLASVSTVQGMLEMTDAKAKEFAGTPVGKTAMGQIITTHRQTLHDLMDASKLDRSKRFDKIRDILGAAGVGKEKMNELVTKIAEPATLKLGLEQFTKESIMGGFDPDKRITAVGGTKDLEKQTGREFLAAQTKINQEIVLALRALANRFNIK